MQQQKMVVRKGLKTENNPFVRFIAHQALAPLQLLKEIKGGGNVV